MKSIFGRFFDFFTLKNVFHAHLFTKFWHFSRSLFVSRAHFSFFFTARKIGFTGVNQKNKRFCFQFHGVKSLIFFTGIDFGFAGGILEKFHGQISIFTGTFLGIFWTFSRALFFHGHFFCFFSRVWFYFSKGRKKKSAVRASRISWMRWLALTLYPICTWQALSVHHGDDVIVTDQSNESAGGQVER